ncbi:unnamed protein product [Clavelina lepadiformis]|uniref:Cytochrome P450 n=1 Tax=Clavelina lepadiformis TaxID=159417 RepID=A0ABP0F4Z6_CLALP
MSETLAVMIVYPIVEHINPFKAAADDYRAKVNRLTGFANNALKKHSNSIDENAISDYLTAFLHEQKSRNGGDGFTDPQLMRALLDFFVAGTETISTSTLWALLFLIHYPEIQKKLYDEINFISDNKESDIEWNDHTNCPYTNAFIQEVFRCRPVTPLGLQRMTAKDVELEGYFIPKGTPVMGNIWSVHHDPKHWKNPEAFQPERHLNEEGDFIFSNKIIPFCIGARVCPGEKLARMEMFFLITNLVKNFEFSSDPSSPKLPEMTDGVKGFLYTPHHYKIVAKARI